MYDYGFVLGLGYWVEELKRSERSLYDSQMMRGPMIEADLDWRAPPDCRLMQEGDL
jgi:hypothetical protein